MERIRTDRSLAKLAFPLILAAASACVGPVATDPRNETYRALGQEPGWSLSIANGWIDYQGHYGEKRIRVPRPDPRPSFNGRRYETERLIVDLTYSRCNDAMSGHGYEHRVVVMADGETFHGCGGERRLDWDM